MSLDGFRAPHPEVYLPLDEVSVRLSREDASREKEKGWRRRRRRRASETGRNSNYSVVLVCACTHYTTDRQKQRQIISYYVRYPACIYQVLSNTWNQQCQKETLKPGTINSYVPGTKYKLASHKYDCKQNVHRTRVDFRITFRTVTKTRPEKMMSRAFGYTCRHTPRGHTPELERR